MSRKVQPLGLRRLPRAVALQQTPELAAWLLLLQRAHFAEEHPRLLDALPEPAQQPFVGNLVLGLAQHPARVTAFHAGLARAWQALALAMGWPQAVLMPVARGAAWRAPRGRKHPPLQRLRQAFAEQGMGARFDGALVFTAQASALVVPKWFWLERCNALPAGLMLGVPGVPMEVRMCQHGSLHIGMGSEALSQQLHEVAPACGWELCSGPCSERFGPAIAGRGVLLGRG